MIWSPEVTVAAIAERDGRFLLVEEHAEEGIVLNQPAGHLEADESLIDAAVRETLEETGRAFQAQHLVGIYRYLSPSNRVTYLRFCFVGSCGEPDPERQLDKDIIRTVWMNRADIVRQRARLRSPLVLAGIDDYLAGRRFPLDLLHETRADS